MSNTAAGRLPKSFSPTALDTFQTCPKKFEFQYVLKEEVPEAPSPHLVLGNAVHSALAKLYRLPIEQRGEQAAHKLLRHAWGRIEDRGQAFNGDDEEREWGRKALKGLSAYCEAWDLSIRPLAVEDWVRAELPSGRVVCGKADRVDRARGLDAGIEVVDYKTGRCRFDDDELCEQLSARLYALAASRTFRQPVVRVRFIYLLEGPFEVTWSPENEDLAAIEAELEELVEQVHATDYFEPRPNTRTYCRWCKFRTLCPAMDDESLAELEDTGGVPF